VAINSFYSEDELHILGFKEIGNNVLVSRKSSIYTPETISIGSNVRIDDFTILSGQITFGNYIHISAYCALYASASIVFEDYSGISPRGTILTATDDFSGEYLSNAMVEDIYRKVTRGQVIIRKFVQIGAHSIVLPGVELGEGSAVGAMSLVKGDTESWYLYAGIPARKIKKRSKNMIEYTETFR